MSYINNKIAELWETEKGTWDSVAGQINSSDDPKIVALLDGKALTGNACRKRYARMDNDDPSVDISIEDETPSSSAIDDLRARFNVDPDLYEPRKIRTTVGGGNEWVGVEWQRKPVSENDLNNILENIKSHTPSYREYTKAPPGGEHLLIPILFDAHIEKMVIGKGEKTLDYMDTASRILDGAVGRNYSIDRILYVLGNDFGNTDNVNDLTTKGTPQQNNIHWARSVDLRCETAVKVIEMFSSVAMTDVVMVHGNHDRYSNQWLGKVIEAWFKNNNRVSVNNDGESPRKYYAWGKNMWGLSHGNEEAEHLFPALMATESPQMYATATYREMFTGHFHRKRSAYYPLNEQNGITIRWMPALSGPGDWDKLKGYIGTQQMGLGILYNKNGYDGEFAVN